MKINCNNIIIETIAFRKDINLKDFLYKEQNIVLSEIKDTYGNNHSAITLSDSLSKIIYFKCGFSSEKAIDNSNIIISKKYNRLIIDVDDWLFIISVTTGEVISKFHLMTPLIGLHYRNDKILILEEVGVKIVDFEGQMIQEITFDLLENYKLDNNILSIKTFEGELNSFKLKL